MPQQLLLLDNTVLSNFAYVDRTDLVLTLRSVRCASTTAVLAEYASGVTQRNLPAHIWHDLPVLSMTPAEEQFAAQLPPQLGMGERACLAVAVHRSALLATDDKDARHAAYSYGLQPTGTLGLLILAIKEGALPLTEGNHLLTTMIAKGYRSPLAHLNDLL